MAAVAARDSAQSWLLSACGAALSRRLRKFTTENISVTLSGTTEDGGGTARRAVVLAAAACTPLCVVVAAVESLSTWRRQSD